MSGAGDIGDYLDYARQLVLDEIHKIVPSDRRDTGGLYKLMLDYPLRYGKSLRPALSIAVCRAYGGTLAAVLPTAAVLELYHNAFLIHDDIEDRSYLRRAEATLSRVHGVPTAINVGDGILALTMQPLLDNMERIGLGKALKILRTVAQMARQSAEGQMLELQWISEGTWDHRDVDYTRLVHKKTGWYSFIAPAMIGGLAAGLSDRTVARIARTFVSVGISFQIQDDILNLMSDEKSYGKDLLGDLWEGKHTLILIHTLRVATRGERREAVRILRKPQPASKPQPDDEPVVSPVARLDQLVEQGNASPPARLLTTEAWTRRTSGRSEESKTEAEIMYLRDLIRRCDSISYAMGVAERYARRFGRDVSDLLHALPRSDHRDFLAEIAAFSMNRHV